MKHVKIFENFNYEEEFSYTTPLTKDEIYIYYKNSFHKDIEDIHGNSATVKWHLEFDHNLRGISGIDIIVDSVDISLIIERNDENEDKINEEYLDIKINKENIKIEILTEINYSSISLYPSDVEYDFEKKTIEVKFT